MRGRPWQLLVAEGLSLLALLAVLGTFGISLGSAFNDGLRSAFAKKPVDAAPAWSRDGTQIAFVRTLADESHAWVMDDDGGDQVQLATVARDSALRWTADGRVLFTRGGDVFAARPLGDVVRRLPRPPASSLSHPGGRVRSPDGGRVAFVRNGHIFVGDRRGAHAIQLTGT